MLKSKKHAKRSKSKLKTSLKSKSYHYGTTNIKRFMTTVLGDSVIEINRKFVEDLAKETVKDIRTRIRQQMYNHVPLNPIYKREKIKQGYDRRILIRTSFYVKHIQVLRLKFPRGIGFRVGVQNLTHPATGINLEELARRLEYGDGKMPARPHFRPTLMNIQANIIMYRNHLVRQINTHIAAEMKKLRQYKI